MTGSIYFSLGGICNLIFIKMIDECNHLPISDINLSLLKDSIVMFILDIKDLHLKYSLNKTKTISDDKEILESLDSIKEMAINSRKLLINGDVNQYGLLMQDHWHEKLKEVLICVLIK